MVLIIKSLFLFNILEHIRSLIEISTSLIVTFFFLEITLAMSKSYVKILIVLIRIYQISAFTSWL